MATCIENLVTSLFGAWVYCYCVFSCNTKLSEGSCTTLPSLVSLANKPTLVEEGTQ